MKINMGSADRIIRIIVAAILASLYFMGVIKGTVAIILLIVSVIFVITSFVGFCPLYFPFGISTRKEKNRT